MPTDSSFDFTTTAINALHEAYLAVRGVSLAIAVSAGLRSLTRDDVAAKLERNSAPCGGLLIPYRRGEAPPHYFRIRLDPDAPQGTPRFLSPRGAVSPYFPPAVLDAIWKGTETIHIVEGPIKALALTAAGFPSIGLGGANAGGHDSARYKETGELRPHPDFVARVTIKNRSVVLVFDAGRVDNPMVALGEAMVARAFLNAGANVMVAPLRLANGEDDQGPDDFLHAQGRDALREVIDAARPADPLAVARTAADLEGCARGDALAALLEDLPWLAATSLAPPQIRDLIANEFRTVRISKVTIEERVKAFRQSLSPTSNPSNAKFQVTDAGICAAKISPRTGEVEYEALANFDARIVEEIERDDGAETDRRFSIRLTFPDGRSSTKAVKASEFAAMHWPLEVGGAHANVTAGLGARDKLREAIQTLSDPVRRTIFAHTGWREIDGAWRFLYSGGVVGGGNYEVDLRAPFDRIKLPDHPENLREAVASSVSFLRCGPPSVTVPIWSAVYGAPVAFITMPDFLVNLVAESGNWKSTIAAVAQSHFGAVDRKNLLVSWESTENFIEQVLFTAKDVLTVVDDYAPKKSIHDQREMERKAQRIIRAIGNRQGRGRMRADTTLRQARPPRGMVLSTGEDLPPGQSINARMYVVEVKLEMLNRSLFTEVQGKANAGVLAHAMRGFIEWLSPEITSLKTSLPNAFHEVHAAALSRSQTHLRMPETIAHLYLGLDLGLQYATEVGALNLDEADAFREEGWAALARGAADQGERVVDEDPATVFLSRLSTLIAQGRAVLVFRDRPLSSASGGVGVGWRDDSYAYVNPTAAREAVARVLAAEGVNVPTVRAIGEALSRRNLLVTDDNRHQKQVRVGEGLQTRVRVFQIPLSALGIATATTDDTSNGSEVA